VLPAPVSTLLVLLGGLLLDELELPPLLPPHAAAARVTTPVASSVSADLRYLCMRDLSSSFTSDGTIVPVVSPRWGYSAVNVW
jgi:hypothetical protein